MIRLANFFSYLFHPLFVTTYIFSWILFTENFFSYFFPLQVKILLLSMTLAFTVLLPVLNLYLLKRFNIVKDFKMEDKSQRSLPYFVTAFFYFGITYLIWNFSISPVFRAILFASSISILLSSLINYKWKISAHMVGAGGLVATIFFVSYFLKQQNTIWICATFLFAGITGSARLLLQAHTEKEVYSGFLLGIVSVTLSLWITLYFS